MTTEFTLTPRSRRSPVLHDYNEAKRIVKAVLKDHPFVWVEAEPMPEQATVWPPRDNAVSYVVHVSDRADNVPAFAIETYTDGRLDIYETNQAVIVERARISESDRALIVQAQRARSDVRSVPREKVCATPG